MKRHLSFGLVVIVFGVVGFLSSLIIRGEAPHPMEASSPSQASEIESRVVALERLLGIVPGASLAPDSLADDYAQLKVRTRRLAELGDDALARIPSIAPIQNPVVTSPYTQRRYHPILRQVLPHYGLDLRARMGQPVQATADGVVATVATTPSYGRTVDLDHGNGFITRYAHASSILVTPGQHVQRGDTIALAGQSGMSTGPHVHYEVFQDGWSIDPFPLLNDPSLSIASPTGGQ